MNLVSNAVKYNCPGGSVKISVSAEDDLLRLCVADTGIGMTPEERARLFQRFYRIRNEKTRHIPGSGLGLSIVRKIVETRGGNMQVESEPGKGTVFTVIIPLEKGGIDYAREEEGARH
jgi:signal transduction histidine kinase